MMRGMLLASQLVLKFNRMNSLCMGRAVVPTSFGIRDYFTLMDRAASLVVSPPFDGVR